MLTEKNSRVLLSCNVIIRLNPVAPQWNSWVTNARMWWPLRSRLWCRRSVDASEVRVVVSLPRKRPDSLDSLTVATGLRRRASFNLKWRATRHHGEDGAVDGAVFPAGVRAAVPGGGCGGPVQGLRVRRLVDQLDMPPDDFADDWVEDDDVTRKRRPV